MEKNLYVYKSEYCVCCGMEIPEGRQVCSDCEEQVFSEASPTEKVAPALKEKKGKRKFLSTLPRVFR